MKVYYADLINGATKQLYRVIYLGDDNSIAAWLAAGVVPENIKELQVDPGLLAPLHSALVFQVSMLRGERVH